MARIDRRTSPNQTALWTVYELVSIQAHRIVASSSAACTRLRTRSSGRGPGRATVVLHWWATLTRSARSLASVCRYCGRSRVMVGQMSR
jgi:hypothetical protein